MIKSILLLTSCFFFIQERLLEEVKVEEGEEGEVDENGVVISSKKVQYFRFSFLLTMNTKTKLTSTTRETVTCY